MSVARLRLITFDITGTILQFRYPIGRLYCDIGASFGVKCEEEKIMKNFKNEWKRMVFLHPNFGREDIGWRNWWMKIVHNCFKEYGVDEEKGQLIAKTLIKKFETTDCWKVTDGAIDLLQYLKCKSICIGVISNFDERLETILCNVGLTNYFNFLAHSYKIGFAKPDVNIFNSAMVESQLSDICSNECLHIGDNFDLDYCAAKNAGWNAMLILKNQKLNDICFPTNDVFCDLRQLSEGLKKMV